MNPRPSHSRGFSLIELMFSMAIGSLILLLAAAMLAVLLFALAAWRATRVRHGLAN